MYRKVTLSPASDHTSPQINQRFWCLSLAIANGVPDELLVDERHCHELRMHHCMRRLLRLEGAFNFQTSRFRLPTSIIPRGRQYHSGLRIFDLENHPHLTVAGFHPQLPYRRVGCVRKSSH